MAGYPTFWFMIKKKWFSNGKHSYSQIFLKTQRLGLQVVDNNSTGEIRTKSSMKSW